ncbi:hemerythrin domain-containing protein [Microbulbifer thermotolerans]|uniref:hemerythrin domain-containing protein n=1 Tax=Microbulbifer thermotolerans TaxID=252514 RepID=UPI00224888E0|nr:hemerythrin domain-containing protein [Microbulbifer thermotolerans]MCX2794410.1 hemerythrin domain-containing protein [Microbulbifer thermotolerans]
MNTIYRQLCLDHKHLQQLLDTFESLLHSLDDRERDPATLGLILDALDYISVYPDKLHHPVEDVVFQQLLTKPIPCREAVIATSQEHQHIAACTRQMSSLFYAIANDSAVERSKLISTALDYLNLQRDHMRWENEIVYPLIEQYLTEADWQEIHANLKQNSNPVFHAGIKKTYDMLHQYLTTSDQPAAALT